MPRTVSLGGLRLSTRETTTALGTFAGRELRGVVRHRLLRIGRGTRARLVLGQIRPVAVEVVADGRRWRLPVGGSGAGAWARRAIPGLVLLVLIVGIGGRMRGKGAVDGDA